MKNHNLLSLFTVYLTRLYKEDEFAEMVKVIEMLLK